MNYYLLVYKEMIDLHNETKQANSCQVNFSMEAFIPP